LFGFEFVLAPIGMWWYAYFTLPVWP
jgi:hypothetical protein